MKLINDPYHPSLRLDIDGGRNYEYIFWNLMMV